MMISARIGAIALMVGCSVIATAAIGQTFDRKPYDQATQRILDRIDQGIKQGPFQANWDNLKKNHQAAPEWFRDAKFGIYFHWGVYSVPAYGNEWYPRNMHRKGSNVNKHHTKTYGQPNEFGYHEFVPQFTAEHFDAQEWARLFKKAGAQYAGPVAEHHDGFALWDSEVTPWNAVDMGPKKDLVGLLEDAIRDQGMRFVTTFHHARRRNWYPRVKGWPTTSDDPKLQMLYANISDERANRMWLAKLGEVIDSYQPDLIWFDAGMHHVDDAYHQRFLSYYFNRAHQWKKKVLVTTKKEQYPRDVSVEDFEKGRADELTPYPWLTDDTISNGSWCYTKGLRIKKTTKVLHDFIDIISKNGQLLLNISPKANGKIPQNQRDVLLGMGDWLEVNGEAIYNTRPWETFGEGTTRLKKSGSFVGHVKYTADDIRYTRSKDGSTLYAIVLGWPGEGPLTLEAVSVDDEQLDQARATLLGRDGHINCQVNQLNQLVLQVPAIEPQNRPCQHAYAFKLENFEPSLHALGANKNKQLTLKADQALLVGESIMVEQKIEGKKNIGHWGNPGDQAHWLVHVTQSGQYQLKGVVASPAKTKLKLQIAGQTITASVPETGGYTQPRAVTLGTLNFDQPGVYHLKTSPANASQWNAINVWRYELTPTK